MRNRFFFIILTTLICAVVGVNLVHSKFFKSQRLKLIDRQLYESSRALLESPDFQASILKPDSIEDTISNVLQGARIGKVFILRGADGSILYQSFNVGLLKAVLPTNPEWVAVDTVDEYVRVRNLPLKGGKTIQVGLVLDRNFLDWEIIDQRVVNYVTAIVMSLFIASMFLTVVLLSPLRLLISHLQETTSNLSNLRDIQPLPRALTRYARGFWARSDEFAALLETVERLMDRINRNYKLTRSWTLQMAHELKTPLAIIRTETEEKVGTGTVPATFGQDIVREVDQMTHIVTDFLDWAEIESASEPRDLHALKIRPALEAVVRRLNKISPGRIEMKIRDDFAVFANPLHLEQLLANLLTNALKYSPENSRVFVETLGTALRISDNGPGFPDDVVERLGQPFNVGSAGIEGNGLGLAFVSAVCKLYQWGFDIKNNASGAQVRIQFPHAITT